MKPSNLLGSIVLVLFLVSCDGDSINESLPQIETKDITGITDTTAISGGIIISDGGFTVIERGLCWGTKSTPTITDEKTIDGAGGGSFTSTLTNLKGGTIYFVRAYALNSKGISYGMTMSFQTLGLPPDKPTVIIQQPSNINSTSATLNGVVNPRYLTTTVTFDFGNTEQLGTSINASQSPIDGGLEKQVSINITELIEGTTYYYKVTATNSSGTNSSSIMSLKTLGSSPNSITLQPTNITVSKAQLNAIVNPNYAESAISFEYGLTSDFGMNVPANPSQINGYVDVQVSCIINDLQPNTLYYARVKAVNHLGTDYGQTITFLTAYGTVTDIDGNIYNTIIIGDQVWMRENLKTTKYRNGDPIQTTSVLNLDIQDETEPKYQWVYNGEPTNLQIYGRLYTWNSVIDSRGVCPLGWHVPTNQEWLNLSNHSGGTEVAGGRLKELGTAHWASPNIDAVNEANYTALPSGYREDLGNFYRINTWAYFWTSTIYSEYRGTYFAITHSTNTLYTGGLRKGYGLAVRCIKD